MNSLSCSNESPTPRPAIERPEIRATATESCAIASPCHLLYLSSAIACQKIRGTLSVLPSVMPKRSAIQLLTESPPSRHRFVHQTLEPLVVLTLQQVDHLMNDN